MVRSRRARILVLVATLGSIALAIAWQARIAPPASTRFMLVDGRTLTLAQFRGRPLVVNFWATTCAICLRDLPELVALRQEFAAEGVELIAVAMSYDPPNRVAALTRAKSLPFPVALDVGGAIAGAFGDVTATPALFMLDADGKVAQSWYGPLAADAVRARLRELRAAGRAG